MFALLIDIMSVHAVLLVPSVLGPEFLFLKGSVLPLEIEMLFLCIILIFYLYIL